ncbi:MptD family putative ECF transporter S component [Lachnobacterium bovis]|uniref:Energy-coupling factor transport system substrate-specific component n=1 Tax=Lachnobacterium bovis DSM 14045 TaxID=1122142 RepID=A0A1H3KG89_9FIRM|nr:MptD family putative ECF transporter S component [Lachnobacterium bovis]SDY51143.1 energy-coupling factor transport system substrate-specific component [Lachnobacterium bovis DSM 14045]
MKKELEIRDIINIGVYTVLHFLCVALMAMLLFVPQTIVFVGLLEGFLGAIPIMIFLQKAKKPGMLAIMGILLGILTVITGRPVVAALFGIAGGIITELIWRKAGYKNINAGVICCATMSLWVGGMELPMFFGYRDNYLASLEKGYGTQYVKIMRSLTPDWMFIALIVMCLLGGVLGGMFAKRLLRKHFEKIGTAS